MTADSCTKGWSGRSDSNARPPEPHSGADAETPSGAASAPSSASTPADPSSAPTGVRTGVIVPRETPASCVIAACPGPAERDVVRTVRRGLNRDEVTARACALHAETNVLAAEIDDLDRVVWRVDLERFDCSAIPRRQREIVRLMLESVNR